MEIQTQIFYPSSALFSPKHIDIGAFGYNSSACEILRCRIKRCVLFIHILRIVAVGVDVDAGVRGVCVFVFAYAIYEYIYITYVHKLCLYMASGFFLLLSNINNFTANKTKKKTENQLTKSHAKIPAQ